jgi:GNAT superfamily N-acetyltransferase
MKLAIVTHAEHPELQGTLPELLPEFLRHDPIVEAFRPRLYDVYSDFQLWAVDRDRRRTIAYGCTVPVRWEGEPEERGLDWALSTGANGGGAPSALCALVAGVVPEYRRTGVSDALLDRMATIAAAHGLEALIAPVRPTWKQRYPLTPIERYVAWRRGDGLHYDPWLRTYERLGAQLLAPAPRSLTIAGSRQEWQEWTELVFPEDGDYVVPGALTPVHFAAGKGIYVEPAVWMAFRTG